MSEPVPTSDSAGASSEDAGGGVHLGQTQLPTASSAAPLARDTAFHGLVATQFLGAFNDNLFKQIVLLLFQSVPVATVVVGADALAETKDFQSVGLLVFSLPFVLFSGFAGFLSDRHGKRRVIVLSKIAEIAIMALGVVVFAMYGHWGLNRPMMMALAAVLFLMGTQSAFFGPGKYGVLPELFRDDDLPAANGIVLMTTFISIILGVATAGFLIQTLQHRLWAVGVICVFIAIVGTLTSLVLRRPPPANRELKFQGLGTLTIPTEMRRTLMQDRSLLQAVAVSSVFWLCAAVIHPVVIAYGKSQLEQNDATTSFLTAGISIGIAMDSVVTGYVSGGGIAWRLLRVGLGGMSACLTFMFFWGGTAGNTTDLKVAAVAMISLGVFTGMFAVPIQVFLQERPPDSLKGRMFATVNFVNWVGILLSAAIYQGLVEIEATMGWSTSFGFGVIAVPLIALLLLYHPQRSLALRAE